MADFSMDPCDDSGQNPFRSNELPGRGTALGPLMDLAYGPGQFRRLHAASELRRRLAGAGLTQYSGRYSGYVPLPPREEAERLLS